MIEKIFVDTDIIIDLLTEREPHYQFAAILFTLSDKKLIKIYVSSLTFANLNYIISKQKSANEARKILNRFKVLTNILPVDEKIISLALNSDFRDFEDAIQYYCAVENNIKMILTRNLSDFKKSAIPVATAEEFVKSFE